MRYPFLSILFSIILKVIIMKTKKGPALKYYSAD